MTKNELSEKMGLGGKAVLLVAAAAVLLAGILYWSKNAEPVQSQSVVAARSFDATTAAASADGSQARLPAEVSGKAMSAQTFSEFETRLSREAIPEGERVFLTSQVALFCESYKPRGQLAAERENASSQMVAESFGDRFCKDYTEGGLAAQQEKLLKLPGNDRVLDAYSFVTALYEGAGSGTADGRREAMTAAQHLEKVMLSDHAGSEGVVAAEALQQVAYVAPRVAKLAQSHSWSLSDAELAEAQLIAAQMHSCKRYGGCGANEVITMHLCGTQKACKPGATAETVWRETNSPQLIAAALAIYQAQRTGW